LKLDDRLVFLYTENTLLKFSSLQIEDCGDSFHKLKKQKLTIIKSYPVKSQFLGTVMIMIVW